MSGFTERRRARPVPRRRLSAVRPVRRTDSYRRVRDRFRFRRPGPDGVTVLPFGEREWHAAALNFGDCLACAPAVVANDALLFVGGDFPLTDVTPA